MNTISLMPVSDAQISNDVHSRSCDNLVPSGKEQQSRYILNMILPTIARSLVYSDQLIIYLFH